MLKEIFIDSNFIWSALLLAIAAIFSAAMDIIAHKYERSIFSKKNNHKYYDLRVSWRNKYIDGFPHLGRTYWKVGPHKITKHAAFTDAWHLYKSCMVVFFVASAVVYNFTNVYISLIHWILLGTVWTQTFNIFYNKYFKI